MEDINDFTKKIIKENKLSREEEKTLQKFLVGEINITKTRKFNVQIDNSGIHIIRDNDAFTLSSRKENKDRDTFVHPYTEVNNGESEHKTKSTLVSNVCVENLLNPSGREVEEKDKRL